MAGVQQPKMPESTNNQITQSVSHCDTLIVEKHERADNSRLSFDNGESIEYENKRTQTQSPWQTERESEQEEQTCDTQYYFDRIRMA